MLTNLALVALVVVVGVAMYLMNVAGKISVEEAQAHVASGAVLVDVRTPGEFASGHIGGARNVPLQDLDGRLAELESLAKPIVLYCRSGARSGQAKRLLQERGLQRVYDLGAMSRWKGE